MTCQPDVFYREGTGSWGVFLSLRMKINLTRNSVNCYAETTSNVDSDHGSNEGSQGYQDHYAGLPRHIANEAAHEVGR